MKTHTDSYITHTCKNTYCTHSPAHCLHKHTCTQTHMNTQAVCSLYGRTHAGTETQIYTRHGHTYTNLQASRKIDLLSTGTRVLGLWKSALSKPHWLLIRQSGWGLLGPLCLAFSMRSYHGYSVCASEQWQGTFGSMTPKGEQHEENMGVWLYFLCAKVCVYSVKC